MGSPGADGQTCRKSNVSADREVLNAKEARKVLDTLRTALALNTDNLVFKRVLQLQFDCYVEGDPGWSRAVEHDIAQFQHKGILPPYLLALYHEHVASPAK